MSSTFNLLSDFFKMNKSIIGTTHLPPLLSPFKYSLSIKADKYNTKISNKLNYNLTCLISAYPNTKYDIKMSIKSH